MKIFKEDVSEAGERYWLSTFLLLLNNFVFQLKTKQQKSSQRYILTEHLMTLWYLKLSSKTGAIIKVGLPG